MIRPDPARVERIMQETKMDRMQAYRHEQQRLDIVAQFDAARAEAARKFAEDWVGRMVSASSIADVIALEHAAGDEAHVTGLPLEHCQRYVRRNAALVRNLNESKE